MAVVDLGPGGVVQRLIQSRQHHRPFGEVQTAPADMPTGAHRLDVQSAALLINGEQVSIDVHDGVTGTRSSNNVYRLELKARPVNAVVTLRASVRSDGGSDSNGEILIP